MTFVFREWKIFNMNEMHRESPFLCDYGISRNDYYKRVMISTAESKCALKITNCTKNEDENTMSFLLLVYLAYIYIFKYSVRWQKRLGSVRSGSTALSYWNCVITPGWRLMRAGHHKCFQTLHDEKKIEIGPYLNMKRR